MEEAETFKIIENRLRLPSLRCFYLTGKYIDWSPWLGQSGEVVEIGFNLVDSLTDVQDRTANTAY